MGTEKIFAFKEDGTLTRIKGRLLRFLDNEPADNDDKVAIRSDLSVPGSAEGLTPSNNLSDVSSAATSRDNLAVPSDDELAEAVGPRLVGPSLYLTTNDYFEIADDSKLSFTDGTDDLPFSISAWIKPIDITNFPVVSKFASAAGGEWIFDFSGEQMRLNLSTSSGNTYQRKATNAQTSYEDLWIHVCATYAGAGPNSGNAFSSAGDGITLYLNGEALAMDSAVQTGTYAGMSDGTEAVRIGRALNTYGNGHFSEVRIFNRKLSVTEVASLARSGTLQNEFADEWAETYGASWTSDFSAGTDGAVLIASTLAGNIDAIGSRDDNLRVTIDSSSGTHGFRKSAATVGKRFRVDFDYYIPSTNTALDGIRVNLSNSVNQNIIYQADAPTLDAWNRGSGEGVADLANIYFYAQDGGAGSFTDGAGTDIFYVRNIRVTQIGTLADYRAENFESGDGILFDASDNDLDGTNNGATLVGKQKHLSLEQLTLTNLPTSSAGLGSGRLWNDSGTLKVT